MKFIQIFGVAGAILMCGCQPAIQTIGTRSCEVAEHPVSRYFTQDVLPGMESNLRMQRTYFIQGLEGNAKSFQNIERWFLASDSVLIPMRMQEGPDGSLQWSGSQNFYGDVRAGVPRLDEERPDLSGARLSGECWLLAERIDGCKAIALPEVQKLETIAAP